jgi:hypothetical protein
MLTQSNLRNLFQTIAIIFVVSACVSGPFKINQSGKPADVVDDRPQRPVRQATYQVLVIPSGAVETSYISDKTSTIGGFISTLDLAQTNTYLAVGEDGSPYRVRIYEYIASVNSLSLKNTIFLNFITYILTKRIG